MMGLKILINKTITNLNISVATMGGSLLLPGNNRGGLSDRPYETGSTLAYWKGEYLYKEKI